MKNKKIWIAILLIAIVFTAAMFAQTSAPKQVKIATQLNVKQADPAKNYFNWGATLENKDAFDPAKKGADGTTGASKLGSAAKFDVIFKDNGKPDGKQSIPAGLRGLFLYGTSSYDTLKADALTVTVEKDKSLTIHYVHRGVAYEIKTDKGGIIDTEKGCKTLAVCDTQAGAFVIKADYLKAGADAKNMANVDWAKVTPKLTPDIAASPTLKYGGDKLTAKYADANGLLTITGGLAKK